MDQWDLSATGGEATDVYGVTAALSGSALSALSTLNSLGLTRHWIRPTMASPWYQYVAEDRAAFAARTFIALNAAVSRPAVTMLINLGALAAKVPLNLVFIHGAGPVPAMVPLATAFQLLST
jgi:hypothetical protein